MVVLALKSLFTLMAPHKRFVAWQECHKLVLLVYKATETLPRHELYGLTSQARRAAFSAAANIVEGARFTSPPFHLAVPDTAFTN